MAVCSQCQQPVDATRSNRGFGSCPECGRTVIRNLADSNSLRRALYGVAGVKANTPAPTDRVTGITFESGVATMDLPAKSSSDCNDTDSNYAGPAFDTAVHSLQTETPKEPTPVDGTLPSVPGFSLERVLGRGGMGTVFLARQLSLDRHVALKVMSRKWADDPTFVARFTREAYAAARLNHPNLVQVYDIGEVEGQRYFSMEFVEGRSLADVVRAAGKLDPEAAVGFILQAARGLKHAHDRGMIHRDIKPDNLLLDPQGLVKVADLGLVKTPELAYEADVSTVTDNDERASMKGVRADVTGARMALGTPAYMSPEQCRDAAAVDHRADIYSLGCTLYALVTGRQPFDGSSAVELMTKHAYTPLVPPEEVATRVPLELSAVIQKMMAKHPGERYSTMGEVIRVLEQWLGVLHTGSRLAAGEEQIADLERCVDQFNLAPTAILRSKLLTGFFSACLLAAVMLTFVGRLGWAFGLAGLILQATIVYFVLNGSARKTYLYSRVRQLVVGLSVGDWLVIFATFALFAILLWMLKLFWLWTGFGMIGAALAFALRFGLDRRLDRERQAAIIGCEKLLRRLRVQGMDEDQLRFFVARYSGRNWEEFFEILFGYEAKLDARNRLSRGESAGRRECHASWREPLLALVERIDRIRRSQTERHLLIEVEEGRLIAAGMTAKAARRRAEEAADALLHQAAAFRTAEVNRKAQSLATLSSRGSTTSKEVPNLQKLLAELPEKSERIPPLRLVLGWLVGPAVRGTLAVFCIAACCAWTMQNNVAAAGAGRVANHDATVAATEPLELSFIPYEYTRWIDTANIGLAGVLLLTSLFYRGERMGLLVLVGSIVTVAAHHFGIPAVEPVRDFHVGLLLGTVISLIGYRFGRR